MSTSTRLSGWVTEWSIVHAWRACVLPKGTEGSNPSPSAMFVRVLLLVIVIG
jgi:hypothetical protein